MPHARHQPWKPLGRNLALGALGSLLLACQATKCPDAPAPVAVTSEVESGAELEDHGPHLSDLVGVRETATPGATSLPESGPRPRARTLPRNPSLARQLSTVKVKGLALDGEESLREVIDLVRTMTGLPLVVTQGAEEAVVDAGILFTLDLEAPISARNLFDLLVDLADDEIRWTIRHDVVMFGTPDKIREAMLTRLYDVRAATTPKTSFRGPRLDRMLGQPEDSEELAGGVEESAPMIESDRLLEVIQSTIEPESWELEGASIDVAESGLLIVRNTPEVHAQVAAMLARLGP